MKIYIEDQISYFEEDDISLIKETSLKLSKAFEEEPKIDTSFRKVLRESSYVTLSFVDKDGIKDLNKDYRNIDKETDVLSFPMLDMKNGRLISPISREEFEKDDDGNDILNLGDIIICPQIAVQHSIEYGHDMIREVMFLTAHSLLHLVGFDHLTKEDETVMILEQKRLMKEIGLAFDDEIIELNDHKDEKDLSSGLYENIAYPAGSMCDHCGYVAILGRPNVGKSTLINYITGMKIAIVSHRPQTTRTNIRSIYNTDDSQMIFTDTPGVHKAGSKLSKIMVSNSFSTIKGADVVLLIADGRFATPGNIEKEIFKLCRKYKKKVLLAVNKSDEVEKETLLPLIKAYSDAFEFVDIIPISARTGDNVSLLLERLKDNLPEGPRLFDSEYVTDQTERMIVSELIREQILHYTDQEIPHGTAVDITKFEERYKDTAAADGSFDEYDSREFVRINADIVCERASHKPIIIGKDGRMIKLIGTASRKNIERMLGCKVYLELYVKVREDWKNNEGMLKGLGYRAEEDMEDVL